MIIAPSESPGQNRKSLTCLLVNHENCSQPLFTPPISLCLYQQLLKSVIKIFQNVYTFHWFQPPTPCPCAFGKFSRDQQWTLVQHWTDKVQHSVWHTHKKKYDKPLRKKCANLGQTNDHWSDTDMHTFCHCPETDLQIFCHWPEIDWHTLWYWPNIDLHILCHWSDIDLHTSMHTAHIKITHWPLGDLK